MKITGTRLLQYQSAIRKGVEWLLAHQGEDGSVEPVESGISAYYKVPLALQISGHPKEALRILDYVLARDFTPEGDFASPQRSGFHLDFYTYANCWLTIAAHKLGRFDISCPAFNFIAGFQNPSNGGFCSGKPYPAGKYRQDILSTSFSGLTALYLGRGEIAGKAGDFLVHMKDVQPCPGQKLYCILACGEDSGETLPEEKKNIVLKGTPGQRFYFPGIAAAFLAKLYEATRSEIYLKTAGWYLDFWSGCGPDAFASPRSGKAGLGAAFLYAATGEEKFLDSAFKMADYLVGIQQENGMWPGQGTGDPASSYTAEFVAWLSEIALAGEISGG